MDLTVEEYLDGLFKEHTVDIPSDKEIPEIDDMRLPPWYDRKKFNLGRQFYWDNAFGMAQMMLFGLVSVFSVPSILKVLVSTQRSNSTYTAYKRYVSTLLHVVSWHEEELKPGTRAWKSLYTIRTRHFKAGVASKLRGVGTVSQRDLALTQFGFFGFALLRPVELGLQALGEDQWEGLTHFWAVIGHMIGLEDRYNLSRKNYDETREACQYVLERVFRPCLTNVPEYFEHMSYVMLEGLSVVNPTSNPHVTLYYTKYLAGVPGYLLREDERLALRDTLKKKLKGKSIDEGVDPMSLVSKPVIQITPAGNPKPLFVRDFEVLTEIPAYKALTGYQKYRLTVTAFLFSLCTNFIGRWYFNFNYFFSLYLIKYLPYLAFFKYGIVKSYVNMFKETPSDHTKVKVNMEYYNKDSKAH